MKKILPILCILAACASNDTQPTSNNMNNTSSTEPVYTIYQREVDAFLCSKSTKGNFTYCDLEGQEITGFMKSKDNYIAYYENGEQINGIILSPDKKRVDTYFKKSKDGNKFTVIKYYEDGSILSKEVDDKKTGQTKKTYKKGEKFNKYEDIEQINMLISLQ